MNRRCERCLELIYLVGWLATKPPDVPWTDPIKKKMNSFVDASRMGLKSMLEVRSIIDHFSITVGFRGIGTTYVSINGLMEGTLAIYVERHVKPCGLHCTCTMTKWQGVETWSLLLGIKTVLAFLAFPTAVDALRSTMHQTLSNTIS